MLSPRKVSLSMYSWPASSVSASRTEEAGVSVAATPSSGASLSLPGSALVPLSGLSLPSSAGISL